MDFDKLKKDLEEKGSEKAKEEIDKLKGRLGNFNSGRVSTASKNTEQQEDTQSGGAGSQNAGQIAGSDRENTTPVMESGKAPVREPETPRREEQIREPGTEEEEQEDAAAVQSEESAREAAMEENPASDEADENEEAA